MGLPPPKAAHQKQPRWRFDSKQPANQEPGLGPSLGLVEAGAKEREKKGCKGGTRWASVSG
jgi:hypothetical protein